MYVYLTGKKEKANPHHTMYVCPAREKGKLMTANDVPFEWKDENGDPKTFSVVFNNGRAAVDEKLGEWMIAAGVAKRTNIITVGRSLLGSLAKQRAVAA